MEQRFLPLDGSYWYYPNIANTAGSFTTRAYVIDSGISPHANFGGRYLFGPGQGFTVLPLAATRSNRRHHARRSRCF